MTATKTPAHIAADLAVVADLLPVPVPVHKLHPTPTFDNPHGYKITPPVPVGIVHVLSPAQEIVEFAATQWGFLGEAVYAALHS